MHYALCLIPTTIIYADLLKTYLNCTIIDDVRPLYLQMTDYKECARTHIDF